jgi:hypothetical protein
MDTLGFQDPAVLCEPLSSDQPFIDGACTGGLAPPPGVEGPALEEVFEKDQEIDQWH